MPNTPREQLNKAICELNDEAFAYIALGLLPSAMLAGARKQIWPDGLGGFTDREKMEKVRRLAKRYCKIGK